MKMRLEREKETAQKEFQKQNIEYEKKLQDQLQEKNSRSAHYFLTLIERRWFRRNVTSLLISLSVYRYSEHFFTNF